jgi:hypothetical protein
MAGIVDCVKRVFRIPLCPKNAVTIRGDAADPRNGVYSKASFCARRKARVNICGVRRLVWVL